ncbi:hypothetical protein KVT40_006056 [Elsinoe batatas]|uniref:Uncharacterized protein n=1 Tax=Elsinoe batatas TaxID=2601811 RepID=A0A8K0KYK5_9PEZI|nr:hypothetical protein KVT40_006056 [Elsinoe batatas]
MTSAMYSAATTQQTIVSSSAPVSMNPARTCPVTHSDVIPELAIGQVSRNAIADGHGYPEGQGVIILRFFDDPSNLPKLVAGLDKLYLPDVLELQAIDELLEQTTDAARKKFEDPGYHKLTVGEMETVQEDLVRPYLSLCPSLALDTGAEILALVADATDNVPVLNEFDNLTRHLCEWAYVVDLDEGVLEVWGDNPEMEIPSNRFDQIGAKLVLVGQWDLNDLPDQDTFLEELGRMTDVGLTEDDSDETCSNDDKRRT